MTTRAATAAETADKILAATKQLFTENTIAEITLAAIAQRSGVTSKRSCAALVTRTRCSPRRFPAR